MKNTDKLGDFLFFILVSTRKIDIIQSKKKKLNIITSEKHLFILFYFNKWAIKQFFLIKTIALNFIKWN